MTVVVGRATTVQAEAAAEVARMLRRPIVLVGLMGAGKTSVGTRLARALDAPFFDADHEIEAAAGMPIADIFEVYGEPEFRDAERRVVARLLDGSVCVIALGGGAFADPDTRSLVREHAWSVWLRAELETLVARTVRKPSVRPLLKTGNPREVLADLMARRHPAYGEADFTVETGAEPQETVVGRIIDVLARHLAGELP